MDLHAHHKLIKCTYCRTVITQCRCMGQKETVWSVCDKDDCKARFAKESRAESADAELARLRAENEQLRKIVDLAREYRELGQRIINNGVFESDKDVRDKYLLTRHALDRALTALDQERKEGE